MRTSEQPVGVNELAELLGIKLDTVRQWRMRGHLPPADFPRVNGRPAWKRANIVRWAIAQRRVGIGHLLTEEEVAPLRQQAAS